MTVTDEAALLRKYNVQGPRYTSYPAVPFWETAPTAAQWLEHVSSAIDANAAHSGASMYVHVPFCRSLCTYCGCNMRVTRSSAPVMPYVHSVLREYALYLQGLGRDSLKLGELHLGGGTPTFLDPAELDALISGLLDKATLAPGASLSIEVDPRVTTREQLQVLARHGFDRISLGVQDFDPRVQEIVNRVQSEAQVREVTETARELGFRSVNFDLIYGLPMQTLGSINDTMDAVARLRPDRIAFYAYAHVPWIKPSQRRFTEADLPDGEARLQLLALGRERLAAAGYVEIGMDHFALPGDLLNQAARNGLLHRNFMGYTQSFTTPLVGLGVSSIGDAGDAYVQNEKNLQQYEARIAQDELPIVRGHLFDEEDRVLRRHILNLMTRFETRWEPGSTQARYLEQVPARLQELQQDGLVHINGTHVAITDIGRSYLRNVCMAFDARLMRRAPATQLFSQTV
jgi:oxygen-independent coproporphyrinogen-3 oxidase